MIYRPQRKTCPLCGSSSIRFMFTKNNYIHPYDIWNCSDCSFSFMNPLFSEKTVSEMYTENYYTGNSSFSYTDERKDFAFSSYVWKARIRKIRTYSKSGNFLDIGCSFGGLLLNAAEHFSVYGIELSPFSGSHAAEALKDKSRIHIGTIMDHKFEKGFFDVITAVELIEHSDDPVFFIKECCSLLKPGGLLVVQTADMGALQAVNAGENYHYYLPGHLSYFTEKNLSDLLLNSGFSKVKKYRPVEFGLLPKLLKSRKDFKKLLDYRKWLPISSYHLKGYFKKKGTPLTSSMVIYAVK